MERRRLLALSLLATSSVALTGACGPPSEVESPASASPEIQCGDPIGTIERESCTAVADEFGALSVSGALKQAGADGTGALRADAIRAAAALANRLKEKRMALCEAYNACTLTREAHAARDKSLADTMTALLLLWDNRRFADPEQVARFYASVRALDQKLEGRGDGAAQQPGAAPAPAADKTQTSFPGSRLAQLAAAGVTFSADGGAVTVRAQAGGLRQVLRSAPALRLHRGRRYLVRIQGAYAPEGPPFLAPGDELTGRVRYHAERAGELYLALRSLEDPDAGEATTTWRVAAGEQGAHEAPLAARPGESGFYLAVGARGAGSITLDDIELVRGGKPLAAARAEDASEPAVKTSCQAAADQPIAGKRSFRCASGDADLVTLGLPSAYLEIVVRGASGDRAVVRTQSLEGGRSLDATLTDDAEIFVSIAGAGAATIKSIDVRDLSL